MQSLTKAQEEIKALEGLRKKRLNKYQEALRKQAEAKTSSKPLPVQQLEEERKKLQSSAPVSSSKEKSEIGHVDSSIVADFDNKHLEAKNRRSSYTYRSPTPSSPVPPKKSHVVSNVPHAPMTSPPPKRGPVSSPPLPKQPLSPEVQKVKDEEEKAAKSNLAKLLDTTGEESIVVSGFKSVRKRYLNAIEACRPTTIDVSNSLALEAAKKRRAARREQALKKDRMAKIQRAWDNYEEKAQDRPSTRDNEEMIEEEKVAKIEAEVNNAWISYAKQVAVEAAEEEDDDDLEYWIAEAKRLKAEAEARRLARLRALEERLRSEEDEYWIEEALKLRAKHKNKGNGPVSADENDDQDEEMAMALELRASQKQKKIFVDDDGDDRLERKQFKKGRIYGPDSDSDADDEGGATLQKKLKKKSYKDDDDTEGLASKVSKKGRVYGDDTESDDSETDGASAQRKTRKQYGVEEDGALPAKVKKKRHGKEEGCDDSENEATRLPSLSRKQGIRKQRFDSDSDSASLEHAGDDRLPSEKSIENQEEGDASRILRRKNYGKDDNGQLNAKLSKKGREYNSDSESDSDDGGTPTQRRRKDYGASADEKLAAKQKKKGAKYDDDPDSDKGVSSKQQRKNYGSGDDGELPKKGKKKGSRFDEDSESDSDDGGTPTQRRRKDYGTGADDKLAAKQKKKGAKYDDDSDSDEGLSSKQQRKNYGSGDDGELPKKAKKKGSRFDEDSESDTDDDDDDERQATHQRRKDYGTGADDKLAAKQKKKGAQYDDDSDSDEAVSSKQQRKNYGAGDDGELPKKGSRFDEDSESDTDDDERQATHQRRKDYGTGADEKLAAKQKKKGAKYEDDSDSDEAVLSKQQRKNYGAGDDGELPKKGKKKGSRFDEDSESDSDDEGQATHQRRKDYGADGDDKIATKHPKKSVVGVAESDSESQVAEESDDAKNGDTTRTNIANVRRKNYGRTCSGDGLPTKEKKKKTIYLSEDSDAQDDNVKRPVRRRKKNFGGDTVADESLPSKQKQKLSTSAISDSNSSSSEDDEINNDATAKSVSVKKPKKTTGCMEDSDDEESEAIAAVSRRRSSYVDEEDTDSGNDAELKVKPKKEFVPMSDSDDDFFDDTVSEKEPRRKGIAKRRTKKVNDSQGSFRLCSESQTSLNASFVGKGDVSVDSMNYDNSIPNSKFYKSEYFDCPSESNSEGESSVEKLRPKKSSSKKAITPKEEDKVLDDQPTNPDGTPWSNPLKGWTNSPKKKMLSKGARLIIKVPPKTDCWRKTNTDKIVNTAPFHWQKITGDFRIQVKLSGNFSANFQKAGIMLRLDDANWLLSGMEFFENRIHHSTCLTLDHTDWSLCQLPYNAEIAGVWFSVKRIGGSYECHYSYDAKKWVLTRQGSFTERPVLYVGICGVNPTSDDLRASFDYYRCQTGGFLM